MIKGIFFSSVAMAVAVLSPSCAGGAAQGSLAEGAFSVDSLLNVAEFRVGDTLAVRGVVRHTCRKGGLRCYVSDKDGETKLRINAPEGQSFSDELIGSEIACRAVLCENRVMAHEVDSALAALESVEPAGGEVDHCESSRNDLSAKKAYMELKGQDYYSEFFADALEYEVVGQ